jgi:hypothetical protein
MWYQASVNNHGDTLNGIVLMVLGRHHALWCHLSQCDQNQLVYGIAGLTIQIALFGTIGYVAITLTQHG